MPCGYRDTTCSLKVTMGQVLCHVDVVNVLPGPSTTEQFLALLHLVL